MPDHRPSQPPLAPAARAEVLNALVPVATHLVVAQLDAFAARLANALFASSESISDSREANLVFNAGQLLKNNSYVFYYLASAGLENAFKKEIQALQAIGKHQSHDTVLNDIALSLVSYEEMDKKLAIGRVSRLLEVANAEPLAALNIRFAHMFECECLSVAQNPFRPEVFLKALHEAWCEFDPDVATHNLILPLLRSDILFDLTPILDAVNQVLIKRGILPDLQESYRIKKGERGQDDDRHAPASREAVAAKLKQIFSGRSENGQPLGVGSGSGGGAGYESSGSDGADYLGEAGINSVVNGQLFHYLADLQKDMALRKLVAGAQDVIRLSQIRDQMTNLAGNSVERHTLDLLVKIFETVFSNQTIPNPVKDLIGVLQVPVLKAALMDKEFFFQETHPARRLIELLSEYSLACDQAKGAEDPLFKTMEKNVNRVQHEFDQKIALFEEVVADLENFVAKEEEASKEALQAPIQRALQKEKIKQANVAANNEVALRVGTGEVVAFVETFLEARWVKVLTLAYSIKEEKPRAVEDAIKTMDDLIWSVKPKITLDQRQELLNKLPVILSRLNKWLSVIKWEDDERMRFFADLAECHASIVRAPLELSPERQIEIAVEVAQKAAERRLEKKAQAEAKAPPPPPADIHVDTVANLERGMWLELTWKSGIASRVRLAWVSPMRSLYIFTTSKKDQSFQLSSEELEQCFRDGRAKELVLDKLVDRALMDALETQEPEETIHS